MNIPADLKYTDEPRMGPRREPTAPLTVGITDHAQEALGDLVFIELPAGRPHGRRPGRPARSSSR